MTYVYKMLIIIVLVFPYSSRADYPNLAWSTFNDSGARVSDTNNVVKAAIEKNRFIPLKYNNQFKNSSSEIFKEVEAISDFELNAYVTRELVKGVQEIVGQFACASYRHYQNKPQATSCNGVVDDKRKIEGKPFQGGQYLRDRMKVTISSSSKPARSYDIYLPSAIEAPLDSMWGSVHELGSFFASDIDSKSTVLSVYIDTFKADRDGERGDKVTNKEQVILVLIPRASELGRKGSESDARQEAIKNAQVLVPLYANR